MKKKNCVSKKRVKTEEGRIEKNTKLLELE